MSDSETLIYTLRPKSAGGTALWLPTSMAAKLKLTRGSVLTEAQFNSPEVKQRLADIRAREPGSKQKNNL